MSWVLYYVVLRSLYETNEIHNNRVIIGNIINNNYCIFVKKKNNNNTCVIFLQRQKCNIDNAGTSI